MRIPGIGALVSAALLALPAAAQAPPSTVAAASYAELADLAVPAPVAAIARIASASRLKPAQAPDVPAGHARLYVEADVDTLIRGREGLPSRVAYLADVPFDARGRVPRLTKQRVILLAATVPGRPGQLRLISRRGQLPWSAELEARLRAILLAASAADAPPRIVGVGSAFHVAGSLPGESETQIFLETGDDRQVSLSVLRRPGEEPRWAVALGEIVDESAEPPARDTLLWYRLACSLPPTLPDRSVADLPTADAAAARADYLVVIAGLGPCGRRPA